MKKLKVIIIDDEQDAIESLKIIIRDFCNDDIEIVGTANSALDGIKVINSQNPDIVFLDVEMPGGTGFNMLESIKNIDFDVVFITAYNHHAIKAFKYNAIDYFLKPVDIDDFIAVVEKIKDRINKSTQNIDIVKFIKEFQSNLFPKRLQISVGNNIEFIDIDKLIRIEADGSYSRIFIENSSSLYVSKKICDVEKLLPEQGFFKPHKSHIISIKHVIKFKKTDNSIIMSDNAMVRIAKKQKESFFKIMNI